MAEINTNTERVDVQRELDQIIALGKAIGAVLIDGAQIDREDVGELGYLVSHLAGEVEKKLNGQQADIGTTSSLDLSPGPGPEEANKVPEGKETKSAELLRFAGIFLEIGSTHAFVLNQVIEAMRVLHLAEIREMSKAIAPFEREARERGFREVIKQEIGDRRWKVDFREISEEEAMADFKRRLGQEPEEEAE